MWFEILPSGAIIVFAFYLTTYTNYFSNKVFLGSYFKRHMQAKWDAALYCRDHRLSGDPYKPIVRYSCFHIMITQLDVSLKPSASSKVEFEPRSKGLEAIDLETKEEKK